MSTVVGAVGPFEGNQEEWMHYVERVKFFCVANGITDTERKKAVLLSVCGVQTYKLIRNLLAPGKPEDAEYDDIVAKVKDHVNPKPSTVVQRFRFNSRSQKPGESVVQFMAELRRFSTDCDFGDTLADMLRDRLVCGVSDGRIQRRLLQEKELTFDKALSLARAMETAALNAEEIQRPTGDSVEGEVHKMQETKPSLPKMKCFRCLGFHPPNSCYAQRMQCHKCKKVGHLARACRGQRQPGQARNEIAAQSPVTKTHRVETTPLTPKAQQAVEEGQSDDGVEGMYTVYVVGKECQNEPLAVTVHINKKAVQMEVDTGASVSIVSESTYKKLEEQSKQYLVINTHLGLFQYNRLPFGVAAAPAIFQRIMDCLLQGIPGTVVYLDDILITGRSQEEHLRNLEAVLSRLAGARIRLKRQKCSFLKKEIQYLGHRIDSKGIYPTDEKVQAVRAAPEPTDVGQLRAYLGLINYYGRFLPGLAKTLAPLYKLLRQGMNWRWGEEEKTAFRCSKAALQSDKLLVHYDPRIPLSLACDASPVGIGAVLSHQYPDGVERPIAYASRSLTKAEQGYAQIDREALSVVFGVKRFRQYVFGHQFTIFTDHKPLLTLLGENRGVPAMCSGRVQRWSLMLSSYQYTMTYRPGSLNSNADGLSRLPSSGVPDEEEEPVEAVLALQTLSSSSTKPITAVQIRRGTERDPVLSQVRQYTLTGWPSVVERADIRPYFNRRYELSVSGGCVFWGGRVVVPPQTRSSVLEELHVSHPGETRMKGLARSFVWWPGIDKELERVVKGCHTCQVHRKLPALAPLHPWAQADRAWSRLHIDFAGPFLGQSFLIVVDAYSKWLEVDTMTSTTARVTIKKLQRLFATHGIPEIVVSDNGAAFTSAEFRQFMEGNGIKHIYSAPYHPSSNGLAERAVATFKGAMKRMNSEYGSLESKIDRFLLRYRITPHATTGEPPALLLLGRMPRSRLDLLRPDLAAYTYKKQEQQRNDHDKRSRDRTFEVGQLVYVKNFGQGTPWVMATVKERTGPLSFRVMLPDGRMLRRHQDHIRSRQLEDDPLPNGTHTDPTASPPESNMTEELPSIEVASEPGGSISETNGDHGGQGETVGHEATSNMEPASTGVRRSARARKAPDRLDL